MSSRNAIRLAVYIRQLFEFSFYPPFIQVSRGFPYGKVASPPARKDNNHASAPVIATATDSRK
jgi:hypothetical protein